ncbi:jacalin-like lectin domain-containing protein [Tanacetum coccineum]
MVAVKWLDSNSQSRQGQNEFLKKIVMLARCKHDNLVTLVGYSNEGGEKIIVYKHEDNRSLDNHLASPELTWEKRLQICLGVAHGLDYLHSGVGEGIGVVHLRNITLVVGVMLPTKLLRRMQRMKDLTSFNSYEC